MTPDIITYAGCGVMLASAIGTPFINILFRRPRPQQGENENKPSFSIVIPVHDNASELERHLPHYLSQQYDGDFEIIVVESKTGDRTEEVLQKYSDDNRLYSTFIPSSSKYMSRKKLAMTVGAKAAKYEWLIFADAECYPTDDRWLDAIARECDDSRELAIGYSNYDDDTNDFYRFNRFINNMYALRKAAKSTAYRSSSDWVAIKRDLFMDEKGFEGNLMYIRGEYDFIVNKFANDSNTAVVTTPEGHTTTDTPTKKTWKNTNLFYMETRRHLERSLSYRSALVTDTVAMYIAYLLIIAGLITGILMNNLILIIAAAVSLIINITERTIIAGKAFSLYDEDIPLWKVIPFEIMMLFHNLRFKIKYRFSDKYDFTSHKL